MGYYSAKMSCYKELDRVVKTYIVLIKYFQSLDKVLAGKNCLILRFKVISQSTGQVLKHILIKLPSQVKNNAHLKAVARDLKKILNKDDMMHKNNRFEQEFMFSSLCWNEN